jgi:type I restriction enzyme S subunit
MSFLRYPKYKNSDVEWLGEVPNHWGIRRVRWLCEIRKRIVGTLGYDVLSITQRGIKVKDIESNDGQLSMDYSKYQLVEVGDFAMNHMDLLTGYVDISPMIGVTSPDYRVFRVRDSGICHAKYLLYLFQMGYQNKIFYAYGQGSSQLGRWRLPTEQFNDLSFPLPPVLEQIAITNFLDRETSKIDALVAEQQSLIELLNEKRQAVISHAVTKGLVSGVAMRASDIEWLPEVPTHWRTVQVKHLARAGEKTFTDGDWIEAPYITDEGVRLIQTGNVGIGAYKEQGFRFVSDSTFEELRCTEVAPRDVLICRLDGPVGRACLAPDLGGRMITSVDNTILKVADDVAPEFVVALFSSAPWINWLDALCRVGGGFRLRVSRSQLGELRVPLPPLTEQIVIARYLDLQAAKWDALAAEAQQAIELLQERRAALISAAVIGQIDVRSIANRTAE